MLFNNKAERTVLHPPPPEKHFFAYSYCFFSHLLCLPLLFFITLTLPTHMGFSHTYFAYPYGFSHTYLSISYLVLFLAFLFSDIMDYFPYIFNLFNQTLMLQKLPIEYLSLANIILALVCITNGFRFR